MIVGIPRAAAIPASNAAFHCLYFSPKQTTTTSAFLINVARGGLVVEDAVVAGLKSGQLDSAGFDVTPEEPPGAASPLWNAPGLVITPHVGGQSAHRIDRMTDLFSANLVRYSQGRSLINAVDKRLGFPSPDGPPLPF